MFLITFSEKQGPLSHKSFAMMFIGSPKKSTVLFGTIVNVKQWHVNYFFKSQKQPIYKVNTLNFNLEMSFFAQSLGKVIYMAVGTHGLNATGTSF